VILKKQHSDSSARVVFRSGGKHGHGESHTWAATILLAFACGLAREDIPVVVASPGDPAVLVLERRDAHRLGPRFRWKFGSELRKAGRSEETSLLFQIPGGDELAQPRMAMRAGRRKMHSFFFFERKKERCTDTNPISAASSMRRLETWCFAPPVCVYV